jgi:methionyl-tRNA formyltransferase
LRLAVLTLDSLVSGAALRDFISDHAGDIVLVGLSNPYRRNMGGFLGQIYRRLSRSGFGILPYLLVNFSVPEVISASGLWALFPRLFHAPLARICRNKGINCVTVEDVRGKEFADELRRSGAELIVTFHFDQILDDATIGICPAGGLNVHPSLLPMHRGPIPTFYALLENPPKFGVTVHRLIARIDAGVVLAQEESVLPANITATGAAFHLHQTGRLLLERVIEGIAIGRPVQSGDLLPYCPFPDSEALRNARRRGVRLASLRDIRFALR